MFAVFTDTSANIDTPMARERAITVIPFSYYIDGVEQTCTETEGFDGKTFYGAMRAGVKVTTSQVTPQRYVDYMSATLEAGQDILFVGLSSGVSGSFQSANLAAAELLEKYPERKIELIDSLGAGLGEGLLALRAAELRDEGMELADAAAELRRMVPKMCQLFTVDDLKYLRATGRLSAVKAAVGAVLHIKPLLKGNERGQIVSFENVRGRKNAIRAMADPARAGIPIIAMTADAFREDQQAAQDAGMQGHIAKPVDVGILMKTLTEVLWEAEKAGSPDHNK